MRCSLRGSRHRGSRPNRKTTSQIRYSGNTAGRLVYTLSWQMSPFIICNCTYLSSPVAQRTSEQEEGEGHSEGVHATVQRAPRYRVRRWILKLYPRTLTSPWPLPSAQNSWMPQQYSSHKETPPPSVKISWNDCNDNRPRRRTRHGTIPAQTCHQINGQTLNPWWL